MQQEMKTENGITYVKQEITGYRSWRCRSRRTRGASGG